MATFCGHPPLALAGEYQASNGLVLGLFGYCDYAIINYEKRRVVGETANFGQGNYTR